MENLNDEIGRIRQILFGHNVSEIEKRIEGLEQQMNTAFQELDQRLARMTDSITAIQLRLDELKLKHEETGRLLLHQEKTLSSNILDLSQRLDEEVNRVRNNFSDQISELRAELKQSAEDQGNALAQLREQLIARIGLLQNSKVDRTAMALLLNELAFQLGTADKHQTDETA